MSVQCISWVWNQELPPNGKLVLLAMADYAHDDGSNVYPRLDTLARKTGFSRRQVQRILDELLRLEVIEVQCASTHRRPTVYRVMMDASFKIARDEFSPRGASAELRAEVIEVFRQTCHWCHGKGDIANGPDDAPWEVDRIMAGAGGGAYQRDNVVLSCRTCNRARTPQGRQPDAPREDMGDAPREDTVVAPREDTVVASGETLLSTDPLREPLDQPSRTQQPPPTPPAGGDDDLVEDPLGPPDPSPPSRPKRRRAPTADDVSDQDFDAFWSTYPRRASKQDARKAMAKALTRASLNEILVGACRYRDDPNRVPEYTKMPATWLNGSCWDDDPLPPRSGRGPAPPSNQRVGKFEGGTRRITNRELEEQGL